MNNFKKSGPKTGGRSFDGRPKSDNNRFGGGKAEHRGTGRPPQLFSAVCTECRKKCEVPFRPTGDKPVYCRDCFGRQRRVPGRNSNGADGPRADFRRDTLPGRERPTEYARPQSDGGVYAIKRQLDSLESKVTRILELVGRKQETLASVTPPVTAPTVSAKSEKVKSSGPKAAAKKLKQDI